MSALGVNSLGTGTDSINFSGENINWFQVPDITYQTHQKTQHNFSTALLVHVKKNKPHGKKSVNLLTGQHRKDMTVSVITSER